MEQTWDSQTHQQLWVALTSSPAPTTALSAALAENAFNNITSRALQELVGQSGSGTELVCANALWISTGVPVNAEYVDRMMTFYKAPVTEVPSALPINEWAKNVTKGLIPKAVPDDLTFSMVLTNAIYFLGAWDYPFNSSLTQVDAPFTNANGDTVKVQMMKRTWVPAARVTFADGYTPSRDAMFIELRNFRGVKLPYKGSNTSAIILLPLKSYRQNVDSALTKLNLNTVLKSSSWQPGRLANPSLTVALPRFNVSVNMLSLTPALRKMDITAMYESPQFGRMSPTPQRVSDVLHSTVVKVNEEGTEAAAVTAIIMKTAIPRGPNPTEPFVFDRPFIFMVVDEGSRPKQPWIPLFMGTVKDPSQSTTS